MAGLSDAASYSRLWLLTAAAVAAEAIGAGTGLAGLDAHQVRRWTCGRRWTVLAMLAHAFRTVTAAPTSHLDHDPGEPVKPSRLTCGQIQHLLAALVRRPVRDLTHVLAWSLYRRTSAARARASHYTRQATTLT